MVHSWIVSKPALKTMMTEFFQTWLHDCSWQDNVFVFICLPTPNLCGDYFKESKIWMLQLILFNALKLELESAISITRLMAVIITSSLAGIDWSVLMATCEASANYKVVWPIQIGSINNSVAMFVKLHQHIRFCRCYLLNGQCWGKILCIKMYWTPAKMLLLADVGEYSFANAGEPLTCGDRVNSV